MFGGVLSDGLSKIARFVVIGIHFNDSYWHETKHLLICDQNYQRVKQWFVNGKAEVKSCTSVFSDKPLGDDFRWSRKSSTMIPRDRKSVV